MGKLDEATAYLSGPMEMVADHGVEWRRRFIRLSNAAGLNIHYIDPTNKPGGEDVKIGEDKETQVRLQSEGRFKELRSYVGDYRRYDLRFVDLSDFLVVVVNPSVAQWGTANEVYFAEMQHKPRFCIIEGGMHKLPRWLFDVFDDNEIFESVEDLIAHLIKLDSGEVELDKRWVLVRKHIRLQQENYKPSPSEQEPSPAPSRMKKFLRHLKFWK